MKTIKSIEITSYMNKLENQRERLKVKDLFFAVIIIVSVIQFLILLKAINMYSTLEYEIKKNTAVIKKIESRLRLEEER